MNKAGQLSTPRRFPRLQFSVLTLLIVTTLAAVVVAWFARPRPAEVVMLLYVTPTSQSTDLAVMQQRALERITSDTVLRAAIRKPEFAQFSILARQADPLSWLRDALEVEFPQNSEILVVRLTVRDNHAGQAAAVLRSIAEQFVQASNLPGQPANAQLIQPPVIRPGRGL